MRKIFVFCLFIIAGFSVCAQDFKGHIMDRKQRPLKELKVWRKNTTESILTDKLGVFVFPDILSTDTLVINVSKKEEAIIPVKDLREVSIKLEKKFFTVHDGAKEIKSEYRKIPRISFNPNMLTREQIEQLSGNTIYDLLNGTIPGVNVSGRTISIRGTASMEGDTEPLFIVNGTQYESSNAVDQAISINDIDKIEVQKEGAGYGVRGANGVIIITLLKK